MSFRALFNWMNPWIFVPTILVGPIARSCCSPTSGAPREWATTSSSSSATPSTTPRSPCMFAMTFTIGGERFAQTLSLVLASPARADPAVPRPRTAGDPHRLGRRDGGLVVGGLAARAGHRFGRHGRWSGSPWRSARCRHGRHRPGDGRDQAGVARRRHARQRRLPGPAGLHRHQRGARGPAGLDGVGGPLPAVERTRSRRPGWSPTARVGRGVGPRPHRAADRRGVRRARVAARCACSST